MHNFNVCKRHFDFKQWVNVWFFKMQGGSVHNDINPRSGILYLLILFFNLKMPHILIENIFSVTDVYNYPLHSFQP